MPLPKDLKDGIFGSAVAMHHRDIRAAHQAAEKYLGKDTVVEAASAEFAALSPEEKSYYKATGLGRFGVYDLMTKFEVQAGLNVIAKEIDPSHRLEQSLVLSLQDETHMKRVSERFPEITPERIAAVLG